MLFSANEIGDFSSRVYDCSDQRELTKVISADLSSYGFDNIAISTFHKQNGPNFLVDQCPEGWFNAYKEQRLFDIDPIFRAMEYEWRPHRWHDAVPFDASKRVKDFMSQAAENGMRSGITASASFLGRKLNFATSSRTQMDAGTEKNFVPVIAMLASVYAGKLTTFYVDNKRLMLSHREREMVGWVVDGKTNSQIAKKMNISIKTVEEMLRRVSIKNNLSGRMQIAVSAILYGSINI